MLNKPTQDQVVALAGIFQACQLVEKLAKGDSVTAAALENCFNPLFQRNPDSLESVFGSVANLSSGIEVMQELISMQGKTANSDTLRYVVGVIHLAKKLRGDRQMLNTIGERLEQASRQADHFSSSHDNVISNLAGIYQDTISNFRYRIQVNGYASYLQQDATAARIRCLLFSGIRCAILWHQLGGRRRHMIFNRKDILNHLQRIQLNF